MVCERCGTVFCWDGADEVIIGGPRKRYCSNACQHSAAKARAVRAKHQTQVQLQMCRERPKTGYATMESALLAVAELRRIPPLYPYECPCGWWHLTSQPARSASPASIP
jgi:hypothetical protein